MASRPGDHVEAYGAESAREAAEQLRDLCNQLHDLLADVRERIDATEGVRHPVHDFDYPNLTEAQGDVGVAISEFDEWTSGIADALADDLDAGADRLDEINDEAAREANKGD